MIMGDPGRDTNLSKAVVFTFKGFIVCLGICVVAVKIGWLQEKSYKASVSVQLHVVCGLGVLCNGYTWPD